jgi:hypothetical protein
MSVETSSLNTYPVERFLTEHPYRAYPHAIHSCSVYQPEWDEDLLCLESVWTYLRVAAGSVVIAPIDSFAWEVIPTTLASILPISVRLSALMLIRSHFSANWLLCITKPPFSEG